SNLSVYTCPISVHFKTYAMKYHTLLFYSYSTQGREECNLCPLNGVLLSEMGKKNLVALEKCLNGLL
ncbi:MAG: hypothetical protein ACR5K9_11200, partial [Wolbachia sp.]